MRKMEYCIPNSKTKAEAVKLKGSIFTKPYQKKKATHGKEKSCRAKKDFLAFFPQCLKAKIKMQRMEKRVRNN